MTQIEAESLQVDVLPIAKHYIEALGLYPIFQKYLPKPTRGRKCDIEPAQVLCVMIANIVCGASPYSAAIVFRTRSALMFS